MRKISNDLKYTNKDACRCRSPSRLSARQRFGVWTVPSARCSGADGERTLSHPVECGAMRMKLRQLTWSVLSKVKLCGPVDPAILLLGIQPKETTRRARGEVWG